MAHACCRRRCHAISINVNYVPTTAGWIYLVTIRNWSTLTIFWREIWFLWMFGFIAQEKGIYHLFCWVSNWVQVLTDSSVVMKPPMWNFLFTPLNPWFTKSPMLLVYDPQHSVAAGTFQYRSLQRFQVTKINIKLLFVRTPRERNLMLMSALNERAIRKLYKMFKQD